MWGIECVSNTPLCRAMSERSVQCEGEGRRREREKRKRRLISLDTTGRPSTIVEISCEEGQVRTCIHEHTISTVVVYSNNIGHVLSKA